VAPRAGLDEVENSDRPAHNLVPIPTELYRFYTYTPIKHLNLPKDPNESRDSSVGIALD
jgi:hypothetical protein